MSVLVQWNVSPISSLVHMAIKKFQRPTQILRTRNIRE